VATMDRCGRTVLFVVAVLALLATSCSSSVDLSRPAGPEEDPTPTGTDQPGAGQVQSASQQVSGPLTVRLSGGQGGAAEQPDPITVVNGEDLTEARVQEILSRLPEWVTGEDDQQDFNRPPESLPPPRTGETIESSFPAGFDVPVPDTPTGPLEVLRVQPDGDVDIAPVISITFDQPMVPLGTLAQLEAEDVPATMTPELPGRWQWIGARTLRFEHESATIDRLPMATDYVVEIPAGTTSQTGGVLAETFRWEFGTPTVQVLELTPSHQYSGSDVGLDVEPVFVARFDQRVDDTAVLETIALEAAGARWEIRLATDDEIEANDRARSAVSRAGEGRFIAFRAVETFEPDTPIEITVGPDVPSAEGPLTSPSSLIFTANTYEPLRVRGQNCERGLENPCQPLSGLNLWFNNVLDPDAFDPTQVRVEPELPEAVISAAGDSIFIQGATAGRTDYRVTLPAGLTDVWGQTLGEEVTVTFEIGPAFPALARFRQRLITTDPFAERPSVSLTSINHERLEVQVFAVEPSDWDGFVEAYNELRGSDDELRLPPWPRVVDTTVSTDAAADELTETAIDLGDALDADTGHLVVVVSPEREFTRDDAFYRSNRPTIAWVQVTDIGLDAFTDADELVVWTTDLATGAPLADVDVELRPTSVSISTGSDGLAATDLPGSIEMLVATRGDDVAILAEADIRPDTRADVASWHVFDDRAMYRPGETLSLKGWVRRLTLASDAQLRPIETGSQVSFTAYGSQGNELASGDAPVNALGGFDFTIDLPDNANLGIARVDLTIVGDGTLDGRTTSHQFQIQEFRRPEFEVTARNETPGPYLRTEPATVAVDAAYFSGGPLPNAPVDWQVTTRDTSYSPPNWGDFTFGTWVPWWYDPFFVGRSGAVSEEVSIDGDVFPDFDPGLVEGFSGLTDANGTHFLQIDFEGDETDQPVSVTAAATVTDVNRQAWGSTTALLVHPADLYVGLRSDRTFVRQGDGMDISAIVTDIDGNAVADRALTVEANLLEWRIVEGRWEQVIAETQVCDVISAEEPASCSFDTDKGGTYTVTSTVVDDAERKNRSELTRWVSGGRQRPNRELEQEEVILIPDKAEYADGDVAEILVQAPFDEGEGLLTVARNGIVSTTPFAVEDGSAILTVPIDETDVPNLHVQVDVTGSAERVGDDGAPVPEAPPRPAFAVGQIVLDVPPTNRVLDVTATPATDIIEPGSGTSVAVTVVDSAGRPLEGAELAVVVVDEAVLALTDYELRDPIGSFYGTIAADVRSLYTRSSVILDDPLLLSEEAARAGFEDPGSVAADESAGDFAAEAEAPAAAPSEAGATAQGAIDVRTDFDALAVFAPEVTTDADGTALIDVPLPDNLTRYRVMVVAVNDAEQFGSAESNITARLPLMVRPSAPRFLNFGDELELPVVLQNQTDAAMDVDVVLETSNLVPTGRTGARVSVPANDRVEIRFPATADEAGTARFRVSAVSGESSDAASISLPVYTPATAEAFATYGVVDDEGAVGQTVLAPTDVWPQFGGLEVNTSSTALQALTDAVIYISEYRYTSADAHASRILAIAALRDVLDAFDAEGLPDAATLNRTVQDDLDAIASLQNGDGGFPIWRRFDLSWPYHTVHVTHALVEAQSNGYDVPIETLNRALDHLRFIEDLYPSGYGPRARATISAYALHVRHLAGDTDVAKAEALYRDAGDDRTLEATAWLWPVIDDPVIDGEIERLFTNQATETAGAATFATDYGEDAYLVLHSSRRTDGIILDALIAERPDSDLIPKVVAGLLGNQTRGRWDNMQENTFILLALNDYFDTFEAEDPDFVARIWLGDLYAAEHEYRGRSTDRNETLVPMVELIDRGDSDLVVSKDGEDGRLYYRLGLRYAPSDLDLDPLDRGFVVTRTYEGVDAPDHVSIDEDGNWHIASGAEVRVRVTMVADSRRTHVALIDPLPAGLEVLNPELAVTPQIDADPDAASPSYWYWRWFGHQNLRDDRAEAFTTLLWAGTYEYTYVTRATTPGTFVTPPARAEEIYAPETFGRSGTDIVIID